MNKKDITAAFKRISPHPLDRRVRLTDRPEDLCAIHHREVSAVICQRPMPEDVIRGLEQVSPACFPDVPTTNLDPFDKRIPTAVRKDRNKLSRLYFKTIGTSFSLRPVLNDMRYYYFTPEKTGGFGEHVPHGDFAPTDIRMAVTYSLASEFSTEWYPVPENVNRASFERKLRSEYMQEVQKKHKCHPDAMTAFKRAHHYQKTNPGDILVFKGWHPPGSHALLHNAPTPQFDVVRFMTAFDRLQPHNYS